MACPHADGCPLYPKLTASLGIWKKLFCQSEPRYPTCARFGLSVAGKPVPSNLMPNGKTLG